MKTFAEMLHELLDAQEAARLAAMASTECDAVVNQKEAELIRAMRDGGVERIRSEDRKIAMAVVVRHDVRITDAAEFAAAMVENGMEPPMTAPEPKFDTVKMKAIAKNLPDFPGSEAFETAFLKPTADKR